MFSRVILPLVVVGLALYALLDLAGSQENERAGIPRWLWAVIIVILPVFGPIAWIVVKRAARRSSGPGGGGTRRPGPGPRRPQGPVAPDDDPEFLWKLDQEKRRRDREGGSKG